MHVAAVGECTLDRYENRGMSSVGGISLNFAVSALAAGADRVSIISRLGDDEAGAEIERVIARTALDRSHLERKDGRTASQRILLEDGGERVFPAGGYDAGVLAGFTLSQPTLELLARVDVVAIPVFAQLFPLVRPVIETRTLGRFRVADLLDGGDLGDALEDVEPLADAFDVLFISGDAHTIERLAPLTETQDALIVVTLGAMGSCAIVRGERSFVPAVALAPNELVDTTGCGDAFQGAFTVHYVRHGDVRAALHAGASAAARVAKCIGALTYYDPSPAAP